MSLVLNKRVLTGAGCGLLAALIWGGWPVLSKVAVNSSIGAMDVAALRFGIAGCLLLPVLVFKKVSIKTITTKGVILASGAGAPYVLLAVGGFNFAPTSHFGIISPTIMLLLTCLGGHFWFGERLTVSRILGLLLIVSGVFTVGVTALTGVTGLSSETFLGDLMFAGCGTLWASYTLLSKHWRIDPLIATAMVSVISMLIHLPIYLVSFDHSFSGIPLETLFLHGIFQGVFAAVLALFFYSKAVNLLGSGRGALFAALIPSIVLLFSALLPSEEITGIEIAGVLLVTVGMFYAFELIGIRPAKTKMQFIK